MQHINALHDIYGHLPNSLWKLRNDVWEEVSGQFYKDFISCDIFGQNITNEEIPF